jgi:CII-binding regulator of phage lambda lysogenization HflD
MAARLKAVSDRLAAVPGTVVAADLVEQLARTGQPVLRAE